MACTYQVPGQNKPIEGQAAFKAWLVNGGLDVLYPGGSNPLGVKTIGQIKNSISPSDLVILQELAKHDEVFRHPVSDKKTLKGIIAEVMPSAEFIHDNFQAGTKVEAYQTEKGNLFWIYEKGNQVWIDVSNLKTGEFGNSIYAAVGNYAYNTGKVFIGDPNGLSEAAVIRRTNAMLSLALKFGSTDFLGSSPEQAKGNPSKGIKPLKWGDDYTENVTNLIDSLTGSLYDKVPILKGYRYDFERQQYEDRLGRPLAPNWASRLAQSDSGRMGRAGEATLRRAVILQSIASSSGREKSQLLERIKSGWLDYSRYGLGGIFSKTNQGATGSTVEQIKSWLPKSVKAMLDAGTLSINQSHGNSQVEAYYDGKNDTVVLVADKISKDTLNSILSHELLHRAESQDPQIKAAIERFEKQFERSFNYASKGLGSAIEKAAYQRVIAAGTPANDQLEEYRAYIVSEYQRNPDSVTGHIKKAIQDLIAAIRAFLVRAGLDVGFIKLLTPADLAAMSRYGARVHSNGVFINNEQGKKMNKALSSIKAASEIFTFNPDWIRENIDIDEFKPTDTTTILFSGVGDDFSGEVVDRTNNIDDLFNGIFASDRLSEAESHGGGNVAVFRLNDDDMLTNRDLFGIDNEKKEEALFKAIDGKFEKGTEEFYTVWDAVVEDKSDFRELGQEFEDGELVVSDGSFMDLYGYSPDEAGDAGWFAQKLRGKFAAALGYKAVAMNDEHGASWLITPGVKAVRIKVARLQDRGLSSVGAKLSTAPIPETITIDGKDRPTRNSNGQLIHQAEEGIRNFWEWFGDSKVVDDQGRPLVVYHGSVFDFNEFKTDFLGTSTGAKSAMDGFFFSDNPYVSATYVLNDSNEFIKFNGVPAFTFSDIKKTLGVDNLIDASSSNIANAINSLLPIPLKIDTDIVIGERTKETHVKLGAIKIGRDIESNGADGKVRKYSLLNDNDLKKDVSNLALAVQTYLNNPDKVKSFYIKSSKLKSVDYKARKFKISDKSPKGPRNDGVELKNVYDPIIANNYIVYSPSQIKSAIGNTGSFSESNPDIRYSMAWAEKVAPDIARSIADHLSTTKTFNWWNRTVGSQFHKAIKDKDFGRVFNKSMKFEQDVAKFANENADLAPDILPKLGENPLNIPREIKSGYQRNNDLRGVGKAIFDTTLRDEPMTEQELDEAGLNAQQKKMYRQFFKAINASLDDVAKSEMFRVGRSLKLEPATPDMTLEQTTKWYAEQDEDNAKLFLDKAEAIKKLKKEGYAPLMRFGPFTVTVTGKDGSPEFFGMFETQAEANKIERAMVEEYPDSTVTKGIMSQEDWKLFRGVTPESMEVFAKLMNVEQDEAFQAYLKTAVNNRSALKRLIHRKKIKGFDMDVSRVLATFITSSARMASKNYHLGELVEAIADIPKEKGDVKDEAVSLYEFVQNPQTKGAAARNLLFTWYLGGSVASAMVNMTQTLTTTLPYLHQFGNTKQVASLLTKAMKLAANPKSVTGNLAEALKRAEEEGVTAPHELHMLYGESMRSDMFAPEWLRPLGKAWGSLFSIAEAYNRRVAFIAAYQLAEANKHSNPFKFAEDTVEQTQFLYSKSNRPNWARSTVGSMLFTFKQFSINYLELLSRLPRREQGIALGVLILLAGAGGAPGADDLDDVIDTLGQAMGYNTNAKAWKEKAANDLLGKTWGDFALHGISAFAPFDVSGRLSVGNIIPGTAILKKSETDKSRDVLEFFGAAGSLAARAVEAFDAAEAREGGLQFAKSLSGALVPKAIHDLYQATDMLQTGQYRDVRGRKVADTEASDAIWKAIGLQPTKVSDKRQVERMVNQSITLAKAVESDIADLWAQGRFEDNEDKVIEAKSLLKKWNARNPASPIKIDMKQITRRLKQMRMTSRERMIKTAPREMRRYVMQELIDESVSSD